MYILFNSIQNDFILNYDEEYSWMHRDHFIIVIYIKMTQIQNLGNAHSIAREDDEID